MSVTLCKFRDERKYDAQFLIDRHDARGLIKVMGQTVHEMGEAGMASTAYYAGALLALKMMFEVAEDCGEVDKWTDYMRAFERALDELEGE